LIFAEIQKLSFQKLHIVLGMVNDKDIENILELFPKTAQYYFCKANIPRGLDATLLCNMAQQKNLIGEVYASVENAYESAKTKAYKDDLVLVTGSFFTVAEVLQIKR